MQTTKTTTASTTTTAAQSKVLNLFAAKLNKLKTAIKESLSVANGGSKLNGNF